MNKAGTNARTTGAPNARADRARNSRTDAAPSATAPNARTDAALNAPTHAGRPRLLGNAIVPACAAVVGVLGGLLVVDVIEGLAAPITALLVGLIAAACTVWATRHHATTHPTATHPTAMHPTARHPVAATRIDALLALAGMTIVPLLVTVAAPTGDPSRNIVTSAFDALMRGWSALATSPVPAEATPRHLVPIAVVVWMQVIATHVIARRTQASALVALPATVLIVAAAIAGGRQQFAPTWIAGAFVVVIGLMLAAQRHRSPVGSSQRPAEFGASARTTRTTALGIVATAAALAVAALGGPLLAASRADQPFDARDRFVAPVVPQDATNPLDLVAVRRASPDEPMFTITGAAPAPTRLVALDTYDGARWTVSAPYERTGAVIPQPDRSDVFRTPVTADVTIAELTGPWLPTLGDPSDVSGVDALVDRGSGSLITGAADLAGIEYRLDADLIEADLTALQFSTAVASDPTVTRVPDGLPEPLRQMAGVAMAGATSPLGQAVLLERYLRLNFVVDDELISGHSYRQLAESLTERGAGTEEQFSTAFAVLGRVVGLPTRVVVGFGPGTPVDDTTSIVRSGDARVWPEVRFEGAGWVAFDPVPRSADDLGGNLSSVGTSGQEIIVRRIDDTLDAATAAPSSTDGSSSSGPARWWRNVLLAAGVLTIAATTAGLVLLALKRRLSARRRAAVDPTDRVLGAWHDVLDRLRETNSNQPEVMTVEQIVEHDPDAIAALTGLYRPVNRALYASGSNDADAEQAWRARDRYVRHMRQHGSRARRLRRSLDIRCLTQRWDDVSPPSLPHTASHTLPPTAPHPLPHPSATTSRRASR